MWKRKKENFFTKSEIVLKIGKAPRSKKKTKENYDESLITKKEVNLREEHEKK